MHRMASSSQVMGVTIQVVKTITKEKNEINGRVMVAGDVGDEKHIGGLADLVCLNSHGSCVLPYAKG